MQCVEGAESESGELRDESLARRSPMQFELEAVVGKTVDLRRPKDLSRTFCDDVLRSAEVQDSAV
jgi:hypothetical protein